MHALIIPGIGTVALRSDGSVAFTNRLRQTHEIPAEVASAIVQLYNLAAKEAASGIRTERGQRDAV